MRNIIVCIVISLLLPVVSTAQNNRPPGDLNGDSVYNIYDLIIMLSYLSDDSPYFSVADINSDEKNNIIDLLLLVKIIVDQFPEPFDYALIFREHRACEYTKIVTSESSDPDRIQRKIEYAIHTNREIESFELVFDGKTLCDSLIGHLPYFYSRDTLGWLPEGQQTEMQLIEFDSLKWSLRLESIQGNTISDSGIVDLTILVDVSIHGPYPLIGNEIDFPLVLLGNEQKYGCLSNISYWEDEVIDLNPSNLSLVIYPDIESLCRAINESMPYIDSYGMWAVPVLDLTTNQYTNRLGFIGDWPIRPIAPEPFPGNETLTDKLGFPEWIREMGNHSGGSKYMADYEWFRGNYRLLR